MGLNVRRPWGFKASVWPHAVSAGRTKQTEILRGSDALTQLSWLCPRSSRRQQMGQDGTFPGQPGPHIQGPPWPVLSSGEDLVPQEGPGPLPHGGHSNLRRAAGARQCPGVRMPLPLPLPACRGACLPPSPARPLLAAQMLQLPEPPQVGLPGVRREGMPDPNCLRVAGPAGASPGQGIWLERDLALSEDAGLGGRERVPARPQEPRRGAGWPCHSLWLGRAGPKPP